VQDRRARTRQLIELGGLVQKAGLIELVDDDRATLLGALLGLADQLRGDEHQGVSQADQLTRWRRRGLCAFDADAKLVPETQTSQIAKVGEVKQGCYKGQAQSGFGKDQSAPAMWRHSYYCAGGWSAHDPAGDISGNEPLGDPEGLDGDEADGC